MARASQLARADDAGNARRDPLWPELAANLLPRRSADVRQPCGAARHFRRTSDADSIESRRHPGDDRDRNIAELDQYQTQAATVIIPLADTVCLGSSTVLAAPKFDFRSSSESRLRSDIVPFPQHQQEPHAPRQIASLFDHLAGARQQRLGNAQAEGLGCVEVDH